MTQVSVLDAKNTLSALLDQVERGGEVTITRRGKAVARLVPARDAEQPQAAARKLRALRDAIAARGERFSREEIRALRDEGRR